MADKPSSAAKRRVKNPETFRERAIKATAEGDLPTRRTRVRGAVGSGFGRAFGPIGRALRAVAGLKVFQPFRRPLRLIGKILVPPFVRSSWQELRKVEWPNWHDSRRLTFAVLVFAIIFGLSIAGVDYVLDKAFKALILK